MTDRQSARIALVREFVLETSEYQFAPNNDESGAFLTKLDALDASGDATPNAAEIGTATALAEFWSTDALHEKAVDSIAQALASARVAASSRSVEYEAFFREHAGALREGLVQADDLPNDGDPTESEWWERVAAFDALLERLPK